MSDVDLATLYGGADLLFFASLYEGFGFPALEAMACGCPVVTSRGTVLEELGGDAVVLADPRSPIAMAEAVVGLLDDPALRDHLQRTGVERAAGFAWERTVTATAAAWRSMI